MAWSAVDDGHVRLVVVLACGRCEVVQPFDLLGAELDAVGGCVLLDAGNPFGAGDRRDVVALGEQPRQRDLCRCGICFGDYGNRWGGWQREAFDRGSRTHISVWEKAT